MIQADNNYCECCGHNLGGTSGYHFSELCFRCWDGCDEDRNVAMAAHGCDTWADYEQGEGEPGCVPGLDAHTAECCKRQGIRLPLVVKQDGA